MTYIEGVIKRYLFYSEENSYSVIKVLINDTNDPNLTRYEPTMTVCGFFPKLDTHSNYRFTGKVTHHSTYGLQFNATTFERVIDQTYEGIIDYLSSDIFHGVGVKTAKRIVDTLGLRCLDSISDDPTCLNDVKKLSDKQKQVIYQGVVEHKEMEETLVWLYGFSISPSMAMKIYRKYGLATKTIIRENPYILIEEVEGIGFKRADEIGLKVGFAFDSDLRISAVIYYLMNEFMNKYGDTYLPREQLINYTLQFINQQDNREVKTEQVTSRIDELIGEQRLVEEDGMISLKYLSVAESYIAKRLLGLMQEAEHSLPCDDYIQTFEEMNQIEYTVEQRQAIKLAMNQRVCIVTGGPGTGKTTVIKGIIHVYKMMKNHQIEDDEIRLAAPTGKAAKRLSESTHMPASTIHRLLGYDFDGSYKFDETNTVEAKMVIIDEISMIDVLLMKRLLCALSENTKLILVGDANQLPSVGPGDVLNDLILSQYFPMQELHAIHRQALNSNIITLAYDVLEKQVNEDVVENYEDRVFIQTKDEYISTQILKIIARLIENGYRLNEDIQVLIPMYKGYNGIDRINDKIQEIFNHQHKDIALSYGDKTFYYQDKVMQLVNQPDKNVMNGDQGVIIEVNDEKELVVDF